jgi:glycosyltransferase involved in cell wall biosynthesis
MAAAPIGSVIIPAHNEAAVIERCLTALLAGFGPGELEVVVACNGCTDDTAQIARRSAPGVQVIDAAQASKTAAIRAAETALTAFPRLYLDADIELSSEAARQTLRALSDGPALAARPPISYDWSGSALLVRSYYRARSRMPAVLNSVWGAGVYGLSATGRARFGEYPDVVGEDLFVDRQFARPEIAIVSAPPVVVRVPRTTGDLVRILRRTYQGKRERTGDAAPDGGAGAPTAGLAARDLLRVALRHPGRGLDAAVYAGLAILARLTLVVSAPTGWERDNSSRAVAG